MNTDLGFYRKHTLETHLQEWKLVKKSQPGTEHPQLWEWTSFCFWYLGLKDFEMVLVLEIDSMNTETNCEVLVLTLIELVINSRKLKYICLDMEIKRRTRTEIDILRSRLAKKTTMKQSL